MKKYSLMFNPVARSRHRIIVSSLCCTVMLLAGCSGDGRAFFEAVEANDLQLKSITILPPPGLLTELVINPGTKHTLSFNATNLSDSEVSLPTTNRRWTVDNQNIATIDENGNLTALSEGETFAKVAIGSVESARFPFRVGNEVLSSVEEIRGDPTLERCIPGQYQAIGRYLPVGNSNFPDGSIRGLLNAAWTPVNGEIGSVADPADGFASATGVNVGTLELTATVGEFSLTKNVTVENTLQEMRIEPDTAAVQLGNTLELNAFGRYNRDGVLSDIDISKSVHWLAADDNGVLSVGNNFLNKGFVTPLALGNEPVTAACGNLQQQKTVVVIASGSTATTSLSFAGDDPLVLSLSAGPRQLQLSTGTEFDADTEITDDDDTEWIVREGADVVVFSTTSAKGVITPLKQGSATIRATNGNQFADLEIQVLP